VADPFVAEIRIFPFNFAPKGWAWCDGQLLPLSQNTALFSLLGTTYGGNGQSNFALPDLQGRAPMHPGQGPGNVGGDRKSTRQPVLDRLLVVDRRTRACPQRLAARARRLG
jgi:microcystin-dependent protein